MTDDHPTRIPEEVDPRQAGRAEDHPKVDPRYQVLGLLVAYELCRGLGYAHERGVDHRDVKPDNVMVSRNGSLKIGDFGIARARDHARLTAVQAGVHTLELVNPHRAPYRATVRIGPGATLEQVVDLKEAP